jgi:hypothetical protein
MRLFAIPRTTIAWNFSAITLSGVGAHDRWVQGKQHRKAELDGRRINEITKPDVDLHGDPGTVQTGGHAHADSFVFRVLFNAFPLNACKIKDNSVVRRHSANIANPMRHIVNVRAAETQKIEILGWPVEPSFPRQEEHRSFEDETAPLAATCEAI